MRSSTPVCPISKLAGCSRCFVVLEQESGYVVVLELQMLECGLHVSLLAEVSITIQITVPASFFPTNLMQ
jgi:hypothetical protein